MSERQGGDTSLTCAGIEFELQEAQNVIDEVNEDKNDLSGADIVDGVLWFPFNLVAKAYNYDEAIDAADKRIARLERLKDEKNCK